ncbi:MAG: hypothetical protein GEU79_10590 [Acidimicrobiia bacterium]|nr:hypothetical protein [Acidimicrobiia bacterium]
MPTLLESPARRFRYDLVAALMGVTVMRPIPDGGGGGSRVPTWLKVAADNATALREVFGTAVGDVDDVATAVGTKTESALPSAYTSVSATAATTYGSELTGVISFLGEEITLAGTRLSEYAAAIGPVKDRVVELDGEISAAIGAYSDALTEERILPDDAEDSVVQAAADSVSNRSAELSRLRGLLYDQLDEAYGLDRSYAAQLDMVTADIRDTGVRLGVVAGNVRNGERVTVAIGTLTSETESDAESTPLDDEELAEQHARDLEQAIADEDWDEVERILAEMEVHNDNPEYAEAFTRELGPVGAAKLLEAAQELDDEETIRVIDVVNDTLMNGLAEYETGEMVEWVDAFAEEDGEDLDVLPLLLATDEGDGRVHAYATKYLFRPEYFPTIDYELIQELTGYDFEDSNFEEFLASQIDPEALIDVLSTVDELDAAYIIAVLFPVIPRTSMDERLQLFEDVLAYAADPTNDADPDVLVSLLDWASGEFADDYLDDALRQYFSDPQAVSYLVDLAAKGLIDGDQWVIITVAMGEAGLSEETIDVLLQQHLVFLLEDDSMSADDAARRMGLLLNLIEASGIEIDYDFWNEVIRQGFEFLAGEIPGGSQALNLVTGWMEAAEDAQQKREDLAGEFNERQLNKLIAFQILLAEDGLPPEVEEAIEGLPAEDLEGLDPDDPTDLFEMIGLLDDSENEAVQDWIDDLNDLADLVNDERDLGLGG